jgi:hypothetical protein
MIAIELSIDGKNSPRLMYVNMPVFFGPERLARFSGSTKSSCVAMTVERSPGLQAEIRRIIQIRTSGARSTNSRKNEKQPLRRH